MENNRKLIIAIIIILIAAIGIFSYIQYQDSFSSIKLGKTTFKIPEGYKQVESDDNNTVNINNGKKLIYISSKGNGDFNKTIQDYVNTFEENNRPTIVTNFTVDNVLVYKLSLKNESACYYWFKNNGELYNIYKWGKTGDIETEVFDLIRTMK